MPPALSPDPPISPVGSSQKLPMLLRDLAWGVFLAGCVLLMLLFAGSTDRGFIYVDF